MTWLDDMLADLSPSEQQRILGYRPAPEAIGMPFPESSAKSGNIKAPTPAIEAVTDEQVRAAVALIRR